MRTRSRRTTLRRRTSISTPRKTWFGSEQELARIVGLMRRIGIKRILYASDGPEFNGVPPAEAYKAFASKMPLTAEERGTITGNVAPYLE